MNSQSKLKWTGMKFSRAQTPTGVHWNSRGCWNGYSSCVCRPLITSLPVEPEPAHGPVATSTQLLSAVLARRLTQCLFDGLEPHKSTDSFIFISHFSGNNPQQKPNAVIVFKLKSGIINMSHSNIKRFNVGSLCLKHGMCHPRDVTYNL